MQLEFVGIAPGGDRNQDRSVAGIDLTAANTGGEIVFEFANPVLEFDVDLRRMDRLVFDNAFVAADGGFEGRDIGEPGESVFERCYAHHRVEAQQ